MQSLKENFKRSGHSRIGLKQNRVIETSKQRKQSRSNVFANGRPTSNSNILSANDKNVDEKQHQQITPAPASKSVENVSKKKNMTESLQKWKEEKQKQREEQAKFKAQRPEFKVSKHVQTKSVSDLALPPTKKSTLAYKNVAPKVVTRRQNAEASFSKMQMEIPNKFSFRSNDENKKTASEELRPFVFAAPQSVKVKTDKQGSSKKNDKTKPSVGFNTPDKRSNTSGPQRKFPVTPRHVSKSGPGPKHTPGQSRVEPSEIVADAISPTITMAPTKQYLLKTPEAPPAKKRKTAESKKDLDVAIPLCRDDKTETTDTPLADAIEEKIQVPKRTTRNMTKVENQLPCVENVNAEDKVEDQPSLADDAKSTQLNTDYFRQILDNEINILENHCLKWDDEMSKNEMTITAEENVLLATGMARLIIREKFAQFRGLIDNCDFPEDPKTRTLLTDLQGFWDMIKIQSDKIQAHFEALEKLKQNDWKNEEECVQQAKPKAAPKRKAAAKPAKPAASSRFKQFLAQKKVSSNSLEVAMKTPEVKTRNPTPKSVKSVLNLNTSGSKSSPNVNAMINVSKIAKSAERKSLEHLANRSVHESSLNTSVSELKPQEKTASKSKAEPRTETPSRSILKKPELTPSINKERKCVLFDMILEEPEEETFDMSLPPVKHTYAHNKYEMSPPKDKFDELFDSAACSTPATKSIQTPEKNTVDSGSAVKSSSKRRAEKSSGVDSPKPLRRSTRLSAQTKVAEEDDNVFLASDKSPATTLEPVNKKPNRKRSASSTDVGNETFEMLKDDSFVNKRRSSRKRTLTADEVNAACGSDLMTFDSPAASNGAKKRRSSRVKKTLLDQSF